METKKQSVASIKVIADDVKNESERPDNATKNEKIDARQQATRIKNQGLLLDQEMRKQYANRIYKLIAWWLGMVMVLLISQGIFSHSGYFKLSETILLAVIGGTTLNVLGLFVIVINYLFPKK